MDCMFSDEWPVSLGFCRSCTDLIFSRYLTFDIFTVFATVCSVDLHASFSIIAASCRVTSLHHQPEWWSPLPCPAQETFAQPSTPCSLPVDRVLCNHFFFILYLIYFIVCAFFSSFLLLLLLQPFSSSLNKPKSVKHSVIYSVELVFEELPKCGERGDHYGAAVDKGCIWLEEVKGRTSKCRPRSKKKCSVDAIGYDVYLA